MDDAEFDVFISHAGPDVADAKALYDLLAPRCEVFLDCKAISLGDRWASTFIGALRRSKITVVLVSQNTDDAYYQTEEIAEAISLSRHPDESHRVVPVYLELGVDPPAGLRQLHSATIDGETTLARVADQLIELVRSVELGPVSGPDDVSPLRILDGDGELVLETVLPYLAIGRSSAAKLSVDDATVSWEHADLTRASGGYRLRHLSSTNPTFVRRGRDRSWMLEHGHLSELDLEPGDVIEVGEHTRWVLEFDAEAAPPAYRPTVQRNR